MSTVDSALVSLSSCSLISSSLDESGRDYVLKITQICAEDRLKEFFSRLGEITDSKLMRTKDGKSRQFAFIGFKTEQEAEQALNYFNNSYMDTSKITCEIARKVGDPNTPPPWSRYSIKKQEEMNGKNKKIADATKKEKPKSLKGALRLMTPSFKSFLRSIAANQVPKSFFKKRRIRGRHLKLEETHEHGTVCSCVQIQYVKVLICISFAALSSVLLF
ncbi:hypothetical protein GIB67_021734 [Kingdonia uniflora]|uniref:RRM domain-containing protein n=1 Tax=Kingdonia uniflora TaxID=39325 RepID=A0A7J7KXH9_9MAGN|nr:hypothetical protein GIB67_021734 [Kingdonia uniflora]